MKKTLEIGIPADSVFVYAYRKRDGSFIGFCFAVYVVIRSLVFKLLGSDKQEWEV